jgi:hypothetical protein
MKKPVSSQYIFGAIFLGLAIYQMIIQDTFEVLLYALAGITFIINALSMEPRLGSYKKPLVIISWLLIAATGILFLWMLQFKYLN